MKFVLECYRLASLSALTVQAGMSVMNQLKVLSGFNDGMFHIESSGASNRSITERLGDVRSHRRTRLRSRCQPEKG